MRTWAQHSTTHPPHPIHTPQRLLLTSHLLAVADGVCVAARTSAAPNNGSLVQGPSLSQRRAAIVFESYTCRSAATGPGWGQAADSIHTSPKCKHVQVTTLMTVLRFGFSGWLECTNKHTGSIYFTSLFIFVPFFKITITVLELKRIIIIIIFLSFYFFIFMMTYV